MAGSRWWSESPSENHRAAMQDKRVDHGCVPAGTPEADGCFQRPCRDALLIGASHPVLNRWFRSQSLAPPPATILGASGTHQLCRAPAQVCPGTFGPCHRAGRQERRAERQATAAFLSIPETPPNIRIDFRSPSPKNVGYKGARTQIDIFVRERSVRPEHPCFLNVTFCAFQPASLQPSR